MRFFLACVIAAVCLFPILARSQDRDFSELFQNFDSRQLSYSDRRFLQAALAFEGDYLGLFDGDWGRLSQKALSQFSWREFGTATEDWHIAILAMRFFDRYELDGWDMAFYPGLGLSVMVPSKKIIRDAPTKNFPISDTA